MFFQLFSTIKVNFVAKIMQSAYLCVIFHVKRPPPPQNIPHLVKKIKGFPLKTKSFQNTVTYQKLVGGVPETPHPLVPRLGYEFACTSEGLAFIAELKFRTNPG